MGRILYIEMNSKKRHDLADLLETNHDILLNKWIASRRIQSVLTSKQIHPVFFIDHFGSRVLNYFINVLRGTKAPGACPVINVMLKFFANRRIILDEIYQICSGMKNSVIYTMLDNGIVYSDDKFAVATELFDANFSGVIREYIEMMYETACTLTDNVSPLCHTTENKPILPAEDTLLEEYFAKDDDEDDEKILFRYDDADDMLEYFSEIPEHLSLALIHSDLDEIRSVATIFSHTSSILLHYSPYLDTLAGSMSELSTALLDHTEMFMEVLKSSENSMLRLFDAVSSDMDRYIQRFSIESIAMKNSHHIHEPTTLSIRQIITMFAPNQIDTGEIEFF